MKTGLKKKCTEVAGRPDHLHGFRVDPLFLVLVIQATEKQAVVALDT